jgi:hypothetical protein
MGWGYQLQLIICPLPPIVLVSQYTQLDPCFFEQNTVGEFPTAQLNKKEFMYKQEKEGRAGGRRETTITLRDTLQKRNKRSLPITLHSHDVKKTLSLKLPNPKANRN